jgi:transposase
MGERQPYQVPAGYIVRGWRFEVETTAPWQRSLINRHFGARRFAHNWALMQVRANLEARAADPSIQPMAWDLPTLRRAWNQAKADVAPWWPSCSKEAYASGIADLVAGLRNWSASKQGRRAGRPVGFPRFKVRHHDHGRVRFSTGAMRLESDHRHLTLPVIGKVRSKENTRRLQRLLVKDRARILSMTLSEHGGRLFVSVATIIAHAPRRPSEPAARCGIDLGIGQEWAVVAHSDGTIERFPHPTSWAAVQQKRRKAARQMSRRTVGSRGHRWHPSSRIHHSCGGYRADLRLDDRVWICPDCQRRVDRDANAALNLRDWTGPVVDRDVQRGGVAAPVPLVGDHDGQAHVADVGLRGLARPPYVAGAGDTTTKPSFWGAEPR